MIDGMKKRSRRDGDECLVVRNLRRNANVPNISTPTCAISPCLCLLVGSPVVGAGIPVDQQPSYRSKCDALVKD